MPSESRLRPARKGFTLVVTLLILAAVTVIVVGLYGIVSRETQTSASYVAVDQADLALQAGLDRAGTLLKGALADELGVVFSVPLSPAVDEKQRPREMLVTANYDPASKQWKYQPLASGVAAPASSDKLKMPETGFEKKPAKDPAVGSSVEENAVDARRLPAPAPWMARVPQYWMQMRLPAEKSEGDSEGGTPEGETPEEGKLVARYCFYVEDLQGKVNLANAGIHDTAKNIPYREPFVVDQQLSTGNPNIPGLIIDPKGRWRRSPSSVWTLLRPDLEPLSPADVPQSINSMHRRLTATNSKRLSFSPEMWRELLVSPDPLTNWPGIDPEKLNGANARLPNGSLADGQLRALEENTTGYLAPYDELALVPYAPGFQSGGDRKKNLNQFLRDTGGMTGTADQEKTVTAVEEIAAYINQHLPYFSMRAGGYPLPRRLKVDGTNLGKHRMAYLKCLAAGMLDYADKDPLPSINLASGGGGDEDKEPDIEYRGTDSHPLVNEYWQCYRYKGMKETLEEGRSARYSIQEYVELWNPTNQIIKGEVTCCFECKGTLQAGLESYPVMTSLSYVANGKPSGLPGLDGYWLAPREIELQPNQYIIIAFPEVDFLLPGGGLDAPVGVFYRGKGHADSNYQDDLESRYRLAFRASRQDLFTVVDMPLMPVERYEKNSNPSYPQLFNVNEPGLAYRLRQKNFAWNVGDSRAAYFIKYNQEEISYAGGSSPWGRNHRHLEDPDLMPGESRIKLWPDGGHDSIARETGMRDTKKTPDLEEWIPTPNATDSQAERQKFVQRISNAGRFYSPTEMGHVFDPIMWDPNGKQWGDEKVLYSDHADLHPSVVDIEHPETKLDAHMRFCGGNSLRIGRVEHSVFRPDYRPAPETKRPTDRRYAASSLLDLFHCGDANSEDLERVCGPLVRIDGHVNVNTASRDTLRALVAGRLMSDPLLKHDSDEPEPSMDNPKVLLPASKKRADIQADVIASAIIQNRPYITPAEIAEKAVLSEADSKALELNDELPLLEKNKPVFGYTKREPNENLRVQPEWSDAAAEELFSRLWNNSTVRSRHFQVVVCGQAVRVGRDGQSHVVATRSRLLHVFVRPVRSADGTLESQVVEVTYSRPL